MVEKFFQVKIVSKLRFQSELSSIVLLEMSAKQTTFHSMTYKCEPSNHTDYRLFNVYLKDKKSCLNENNNNDNQILLAKRPVK